MRRSPLQTRIVLMSLAGLLVTLQTPVRALVFNSTYQKAVDERDQARKEVETTRSALAGQDKALSDRVYRMQQASDLTLMQLEAERQNRLKWESLAILGTVGGSFGCLLVGAMTGLAVGTKARRDYVLQRVNGTRAVDADIVQ